MVEILKPKVEVMDKDDLLFNLAYIFYMMICGSVEKKKDSVYIHYSDHPGDDQNVVVFPLGDRIGIVYDNGGDTSLIVYSYDDKIMGIRISKYG